MRFLNIEPKNGGNYTNENHSWGAQTIAHNTISVNEKSDFNGDYNISSAHHSDIQYADFSNPDAQVVSGSENNAFNNVQLKRTTAVVRNESVEFPLVIDIFKVNAKSEHQFDLPFYYNGQLISTDFQYAKNANEMKTLGSKNGYQHLWLEARGTTNKPNATFTFVNGNRFYSITTITNSETELMMTRIGANDPDFNLRNNPGFLIRQPNAMNHTFVTIVEPHGLYDLSREVTSGFKSAISDLKLLIDNDDLTALQFRTTTGRHFLFITVNKNFDKNITRTCIIAGKEISFKGNFIFKEISDL